MQSSQFSIYNEMYQEQLKYVNSECDLALPTEILPPSEAPEPEGMPFCPTQEYYTTKEGDTCDSIATEQGVSAAMLFYGNQGQLKNCQHIQPGESICLPMACKVYAVQPDDTCEDIANAFDLGEGAFGDGDLRWYNSWLDHDCLKLQTGAAAYGRNICVSPPGGKWRYTPERGIPSVYSPKPGGDGFTSTAIPPPRRSRGAGRHDAELRAVARRGGWRPVF